MAADSRDWMVRAQCRDAPLEEWHLWESDNRGGGQTESGIVESCRGCPVARECATYGLMPPGPGGMVWAGIPVPESPTTPYYKRAVAALEAIRDGARPW